MATTLNKYYKWRRKRIRTRARKRRDEMQTKDRSPYIQTHMTPKEREKYEKFGLKWYFTSNLNFGTDVTGLGISPKELNELTMLPFEAEKERRPVQPIKHDPIVVTFATVKNLDGTDYEYALYNGSRVHPVFPAPMPFLESLIERERNATTD